MNRLLLALIAESAVVLLWGTIRSYRNVPPMPERIVTTEGENVFTREHIREGQTVFQKYNLMGFGTLPGDDSYFGPGFAARASWREYLNIII